MQALRTYKGIVVPLDRINVDTDQIIPKQFLKRIERTGYGEFLFYDWRFSSNGVENTEFVLNRAPYRNGGILLARRNFGCGSSREHAAWALLNYGFRAVIAPSFADIFLSNASKNGLLTITLPEEKIEQIFRRADYTPGYELTVDVASLTIDDGAEKIAFEMDSFRQRCLLEGLDDIGLTMQYESSISSFEQQRPAWSLGSPRR